MSTVTTPLAVKIDPELKTRLRSLANAQHRSTHWLMREAIRQYVEREERRENFRQEAIQAWNEYQATGMHLTMTEADAWLAKLESGKDLELPEPSSEETLSQEPQGDGAKGRKSRGKRCKLPLNGS